MSRTTLGIKVDETTRARLIALAEAKGRTPHWILKTAVAQYLEHAERVPPDCPLGGTWPPQCP